MNNADERIERLRDWIQEWADEECPYGEPDFEACGHNRRHGICRAHSASRVLAQDTFVSDDPDLCAYCGETDMNEDVCSEQSEMISGTVWTCTRRPGHDGNHVACGAHHIVATWPATADADREVDSKSRLKRLAVQSESAVEKQLPK